MPRHRRKRKCRNCHDLFLPDHRNVTRQKYCSQPECRQASKAESQRRWLSKAENRDYFKGPHHVRRVQQWRANHPGYWHRHTNPSAEAESAESIEATHKLKQKPCDSTPQSHHARALQDPLSGISNKNHEDNALLVEKNTALQDSLIRQQYVLAGIIAQLTGSTLQDDMVSTMRRLQQSGYDILAPMNANGSPMLQGDHHVIQTPFMPTTGPPGS